MKGNPDCQACDLYRSAQSVCLMGSGKIPTDIMVVGEAPGNREDDLGKPLQGQAGKMLDTILGELGVSRKDIYITNVCKCRPPQNRTPRPAEIKACKQYLEQEIKTVKPKFVLLLGATALKAVLGKAKITEIHGQIFEKDGIQYLPTFHPAAALRDPRKYDPVKADLERFFELAATGKAPDDSPDLEWSEIRTFEQFNEMLEAMESSRVISWDIETTSLNRFDGVVNCMGFAVPGRQWILPLEMNGSKFRANHELQVQMLELISEALKDKVGVTHNGKFDVLWILHKYGVRLPSTFDTMLASHLLDENSTHKLKYLSKIHFKAPSYDLTTTEKKGKVMPAKLYKYCAMDVFYTLKLYYLFKAQLRRDSSLRKIFKYITMPAQNAFVDIEMEGVYVHLDRMADVKVDLKRKIAEVEKKLYQYTKPENVNWNSPQQVAKILFGKWGLSPLEKTAGGGDSTGESILKRLRDGHPGVDLLLEYRGHFKQYSSFVKGWEKRMHKGKIHPSFKLHGTVTGRLCLREGTQIMVPGGTKPIEDIVAGDWVYSYDDNLKLCLRRVKWSGLTGRQKCYRVHWIGQGHKHEGYLDATGNHPLRLTSGEYIKVKDLQGGKLVRWRGRYHRGEHVLALHRAVKDGRNFLYSTGGKWGEREARIVFQQTQGWVPDHVHHEDGNPLNDAPDNLKGMGHGDHLSMHACRDSDEMRRRGVESGGLGKALVESLKARRKRYNERFTEKQVREALVEGNGLLGAAKLLGCGHGALKRRMTDWEIEYDGRSSKRIKPHNHMVTYMEELPGTYPVYDLEVEDTHNFIANELCVHNSCVDPNLQQVPRDSSIRSLIGAPPGWTFVQADYSQIELRVAAMLSGEPNMKMIFQTGGDIHTKTAQDMTGKPEPAKEERKKAKAVNFGFLYGMGWMKFVEYARDKYDVHLTDREAKQFRKRYFEAYPGLAPWHQKQRKLANSLQQVRNPIGRIRRLPEVLSPEQGLKAEAERQAINSPVQGFASDITQMALVELHQTLFNPKIFKLLGSVHDSVLMLIKDEYLDEMLPKVKAIMESPKLFKKFKFRPTVPIIVDIETGNWGAGKSWTA